MISWMERLWLSCNAIAVFVFCTYLIIFRALGADAPWHEYWASAQGEIATYAVCGALLLMNLAFVVYALTTVDRKLVFRNEDGDS